MTATRLTSESSASDIPKKEIASTQQTEAENNRDLKKKIKQLSGLGITYSDLAGAIGAEWGWNANAIKLFANREGASRNSPKNLALRETVERLIRDVSSRPSPSASLANIPQTNLDKFAAYVGNRFHQISKASSSFPFDPLYSFVRWDTERNNLVCIMLETRSSPNGCSFAMKSSGKSNNQRVVIGDALHTVSNTIFSGLSYEVLTPPINLKNLDPFDLDSVMSVVAKTERGIESLVLENSDLHRGVAPVVFHGVDGGGHPISGIGALIKETEFATYGISSDEPSSKQCSSYSEELAQKMSEFNASTLKPGHHQD